MLVLSKSETEQRYRHLGRHDQLRTYQRMMRRRRRGARRRLIPNIQQNAQSTPTIQAAHQITPLNQTENHPQNQAPQNQTPYAPNQMGRYTPYRRRNRQNERYRNEHIEDRTCYICYTDMLRGECIDVCLHASIVFTKHAYDPGLCITGIAHARCVEQHLYNLQQLLCRRLHHLHHLLIWRI